MYVKRYSNIFVIF